MTDREVCGECSAPKALCECEYDVVLDVLQKHSDKLWEMTKRNIDCEYLGMNIMDQVRLEHIDKIKEAIHWWKARGKP